jgi:hypothetical protein
MFKDDGKIELPEAKVDPDSLNPKLTADIIVL